MMITIAYLVSNQRAYRYHGYRSFEGLYTEIKMCWLQNFLKKHDLPFLKLEDIHNFDTYFHPLRNIVLKLFDDKIM